MKTFIQFIVLFLFPFMAFAQPAYQRNPITTNLFMNAAADGLVPKWNATAAKWSNSPSIGSVSPPLSSVQYNSNGVLSGSLGFVFTNNLVGIGGAMPDQTLSLNAASGSTVMSFRTAGSSKAFFGLSDAIDFPVVGMTAGDFGFRVQANDMFFSADSGVSGQLVIKTNGNVGIGTVTPTSGKLVIDGGHLTFGTDNTYDIGASVANRPRLIYVGTGIAMGAGSYVQFGTRGYLYATADGVWKISDNADTSVNRLQFGGTTAAFGAIAKTNAHFKIAGADGNLTTATNALWFQGQHWTGAITATNVTQQSGKVRLAAGSQSYFVTNNHITTASIVLATVNSDDTTATSVKAIVSAGLLQLKAIAATTADTDISWFIATP